MKKQYINPTMDVVNMKMEQCLLTGSEKLGVGSGTMSVDKADSREFDDFDWED